jgi:hypothetical protein
MKNNKKIKLLRDAIHTTFLMHALEDDADILLMVNLDSYFDSAETSTEFLKGIIQNYEWTIRNDDFLPCVSLRSNGDSIVQLISLQGVFSALQASLNENMEGSSSATDFAESIFAIKPNCNIEQLKFIKQISST